MDAEQTFKTMKFLQTAFTGLMGGSALYISLVEHPARMAIKDTESAHQQFLCSFNKAARYMAVGSMFPMVGGAVAWYLNPKEGLPNAIISGLYLFNAPYSFLFLIPNYVNPIKDDYSVISKKYSDKEIRDTMNAWCFYHTLRTTVDVGGFIYGVYCLIFH